MVDIYIITNMINGKEYVGITMNGYLKRFDTHKYRSRKSDDKRGKYILYRAMRKYGIENFKVELLEQVDTYEEAKIKEIYYISKFNTYIKSPLNWGYNMTIGGDGNGCSFIISEKTRKLIGLKISELHKNAEYREKFLERMRSKEIREKIGNANRGEKNGMYGNGHLVSGEKNHWYGKKGNDHVQYGRTRSQETKDSLRENTTRVWKENQEFRENNLKHLKELGEKQRGLNNPAAKRTYLYNSKMKFVGEYSMKELYDILNTYPAKVRKYRDSGIELNGHFIYSKKV